MYKIRPFVVFLAIVLISGCAINREGTFKELINKDGPVALTNAEAIASTSVITLSPSTTTESELDLDDSLIQFGRARSNYKVFELPGSVGQSYQIELRTLCDCLGFNRKSRKIVYPIVYVTNANGDIVKRPTEVDAGDEPQGVPKNIKAIVDGEFGSDGPYYLIVAADTRRLGLTVPDDNEQLLDVPFPYITLPIASYPVGDFTVRFTVQ